MAWPVTFDSRRINLHVPDRIAESDASRQTATVQAILKRLSRQPGLILADEVGMGKTFVALAVAASVAWAEKQRRPVVVMVPPSLSEKWPIDFEVFCENCLPREEDGEGSLTYGVARRGVEFFRLLDDPKPQRKQIIFLTHGALSRSLQDPWTRLAILKAALRPSRYSRQRQAFPRFAAEILLQKSRYGSEELYYRLMKNKADKWRKIISDYGPDPGDDPVPEAIFRVLARNKVNLTDLRKCLTHLPIKSSAYLAERIRDVRRELAGAMQDVWQHALVQAKVRSPLLILDEAHHLKNPATKLASLFVEDDAKADADQISGALDGAFERMLFLTATPFQLGHHELLNVLGRFRGVRWDKRTIPVGREDFAGDMQRLEQALNQTYHASTWLDRKWASLKAEDLQLDGQEYADPERWWRRIREDGDDLPERVKLVLQSYKAAQERIRETEKRLRPWVIRHRRARQLPKSDRPRRVLLTGEGIESDDEGVTVGLGIRDQSVLPFLLAARSQTILAQMTAREAERVAGRATFAEGLASSYEAFLETRRRASEIDGGDLVDEDVPEDRQVPGSDTGLTWYLDRLRQTLPETTAYSEHPKIQATVRKVLELWKQGEKVLVFCHFRATGRALEEHLSAAFREYFRVEVARRTGCALKDAERRLENVQRGFSTGRTINVEFNRLLARVLGQYPELSQDQAEQVTEAARSLVRTPSFIIRYFPLEEMGDQGAAFRKALAETDASGLSLEAKIRDFADLLARRCRRKEREEYLKAVETVRTGERNVRLVNGGTDRETRRNLLLTFNTPFFPEVLVASAVLAEGVDLHRNCRYVIHHDLCWNPSTLEQRTGRVDRINAKAERVKQSIHVYLPYLAETQDEKMYRVVRDRERWFQVIMGEEYRVDETWANEVEQRVLLPESAARELAFRLEVHRATDTHEDGPMVRRA